jgi:7-keto-8-aminopelargonate synthetase-like enzyme
MKEPQPLIQVDRTYALIEGRKLAYFSGCDYFRLATHSKVIEAAQKAASTYGLSVSASRMTSGNHPLFLEAEKVLREFFSAADVLLVSAGYFGNLVVAQALAGSFSHVLLDEAAHPSLEDAAGMFDAPVVRFKHLQPEDVERQVARIGKGAKLILLTDGMYSNDGAAAPLREYLRVLPKDALVLLDDAHGAGVLGATGQGTLEHCGASRDRVIQTGTLSKAFGAGGGMVVGNRELRRRIVSKSHLFVGSTPPPLPIIAAALTAARLLRRQKGFVARLRKNATWLKTELRQAGLRLPETPGPIIPILPGTAAEATSLNRELLKARILPPFIKYPGGPASGYFRFVISSEHTQEQLQNLLIVLSRHLKRFPSVQ